MKRALLPILALLIAVPAFPATQLTYMVGDRAVPISWNQASFPIPYSIDRRAASSLAGGILSVTHAFQAWSEVPGTLISFAPAGLSDGGAGKDGRNTVSVSDDLFATSGFLAYTTTWFDDTGRIQEADIQIDAGSVSDPNVSGLIEHEVGHFLGLDHSAVLSSMMYPYVQPAGEALDSDDRLAISTMYPNGGSTGKGMLRGSVFGIDGAVFAAQVVAVDDRGAPASSVLTDAQGQFALSLPAGDYRLYAEPLDGPVDVRNLSGVWRGAKALDFRTVFYPAAGTIHLDAGQTIDSLALRGDGQASLNPQWIGTFSGTTARDVRMTSMTVNVIPGQTVSIAVGGEGMTPGVTQFEVLSSDLTRVSAFDYGTNYVWATFKVAPKATPTSLVVLVRNGADEATLTGALRITQAPVRRRAIQ